jgi:hypothetical protein
MPDLRPILTQLDTARRGLLLAADSVPNARWKASPRLGAWSAGEVVAHLTMVEGTIISKADQLVRQPPNIVPIWRRAHLPVLFAEWRGVRRRTPIPLDPSLVTEKETMLARLRGVREKTLAFIEGTRDRDLSTYRWPHPFFGSLNLYDWFRTIAHHEVRHTKQIQEIIAAFPK